MRRLKSLVMVVLPERPRIAAVYLGRQGFGLASQEGLHDVRGERAHESPVSDPAGPHFRMLPRGFALPLTSSCAEVRGMAHVRFANARQVRSSQYGRRRW